MGMISIISLCVLGVFCVGFLYSIFEIWLRNRLIEKLIKKGYCYYEIQAELKARGWLGF